MHSFLPITVVISLSFGKVPALIFAKPYLLKSRGRNGASFHISDISGLQGWGKNWAGQRLPSSKNSVLINAWDIYRTQRTKEAAIFPCIGLGGLLLLLSLATMIVLFCFPRDFWKSPCEAVPGYRIFNRIVYLHLNLKKTLAVKEEGSNILILNTLVWGTNTLKS